MSTTEYITEKKLSALDDFVRQQFTDTSSELSQYAFVYHPSVVELSRATKGCLKAYPTLNDALKPTNGAGYTQESFIFDSRRYLDLSVLDNSQPRFYLSGKGHFVQDDPVIVLFPPSSRNSDCTDSVTSHSI
jgi:hypothetical protein